jgi:Mg-chelatase subunit ChlD
MLTIANFINSKDNNRAVFVKPSDDYLSSFTSSTGMINVLFMIDNSGSMGERL